MRSMVEGALGHRSRAPSVGFAATSPAKQRGRMKPG